MEEEIYNQIINYLENNIYPENVTNKSNWKQKTKKFFIGEISTFGRLYYRKLVVNEEYQSLNTQKKVKDWKKDEDYKVTSKPSFIFQAVVKKNQCEKIVKDSHIETCHGGRNAMRYQLRSYYIEGRENLIEKFKVCDECDAYKSLPEVLPFTPIFSKSPGERLQFDFTFYLSNTIFTVIDHFSKFAFAHVTTSRKTSIVIELLQLSIKKLKKNREVEIIILQSDNGAEFCSKKIKEFCANNNYSLLHGRVRHPQSQGCVERFHRTLKKNIKLLISMGKTFEQAVENAVKTYNNTFHHTLGMTPKEALNLTAIKNPNPIQMTEMVKALNSISLLQSKRSELDSKIKSKRLNPERRIEVGDIVYFKHNDVRIRGKILERSKNNRVKAIWDEEFPGSDKFLSVSILTKSVQSNNRKSSEGENNKNNEVNTKSNELIIMNDNNENNKEHNNEHNNEHDNGHDNDDNDDDNDNGDNYNDENNEKFSNIIQINPNNELNLFYSSEEENSSEEEKDLILNYERSEKFELREEDSPSIIPPRRSNRKKRPISKNPENQCYTYQLRNKIRNK